MPVTGLPFTEARSRLSHGAVVRADRLTGLIGILSGRQRSELVDFMTDRHVSAKAADVGCLQYGVAWQLALNGQVELLDVRPGGVGGNGDHAQRKLEPASTGLVIADEVVLVRRLHHRRGAFEGFGVAFVAIGVLEEDAVAAADGELSIAEDVVCETRYAARD